MNKPIHVTITGATGKIGKAATLQLIKSKRIRPKSISICYKENVAEAKRLQKIAGEFGIKAIIKKFDLADQKSIKKILTPCPDILIHAAGTFPKGKWPNVKKREFEAAIRENLQATFFLVQEAAKKMKRGKIILMTDASTKKFYKDYVPYCLAKAGVEALVRGLWHMLAPDVSLNAVAPYVIGRPKGLSQPKWIAIRHKSKKASEIAKIIEEMCTWPIANSGNVIGG